MSPLTIHHANHIQNETFGETRKLSRTRRWTIIENCSERDVGHRQRCIVLGMEQWFEINNVNGACASGQGAFIVNGAFVGAEFGDWGLGTSMTADCGLWTGDFGTWMTADLGLGFNDNGACGMSCGDGGVGRLWTWRINGNGAFGLTAAWDHFQDFIAKNGAYFVNLFIHRVIRNFYAIHSIEYLSLKLYCTRVESSNNLIFVALIAYLKRTQSKLELLTRYCWMNLNYNMLTIRILLLLLHSHPNSRKPFASLSSVFSLFLGTFLYFCIVFFLLFSNKQ